MDSAQPHPLIDQLIPLQREADFDELFLRLTAEQSSNTRFLLKMELNRRGADCRRVIDMRSEWPQACRVFEFAGITHFMPDEAVAQFQSHCYLYRDRYTLGVYEAMQAWQHQAGNRALSPHQPAPGQLRQLDVNLITFASYVGRSQDRMHFSSPLELQLGSGERISAKSSDLSTGGIRISVPYLPRFEEGDQVLVHFHGLDKEAPHPCLGQGIGYRILGQESRDDRYWLRLVREGENAPFDAHLAHFIESNKGRYRVSVDHLLSAAIIKGYEQFFLPRMSGLPLFFSKGEPGEAPRLEVVLKSENNLHLLEYWRDEKNQPTLAGLFPPARLRKLLPDSDACRETLIYSFTHAVRSHLYFFSASAEELAESGLHTLFFQVAAKRPSFRVYKFSLEACALAEADISSLPTREQPLSQDTLLRARLDRLGYVGLLQEIPSETIREEYLTQPQVQHDANALQRFGHDLGPAPFEVETLHYVQLRREARYLHKTAIALRLGEQAWVGWTRDISAHGMQIELEAPFPGNKGDLVTVALPKLQPLTKHLDLQTLPYRLVNFNQSRTVLHLCIEGEPERHTGRHFFSLLIESNRSKLKTAEGLRRYRGLARALRNIYSHHVFSTPVYINKGKNSIRPATLAQAPRPRSLARLLQACADAPRQANLYPLLQGDLLRQLLLEPLRTLAREDLPREAEIYVSWQRLANGAPQFHSVAAASLTEVAAKRAFIEQARAKGEFYSVQLGLSRTGRPDTNFIASELDYIAKFAIHKAKRLEDELWSVVGVGELTDTTQATLLRLGLGPAKG